MAAMLVIISLIYEHKNINNSIDGNDDMELNKDNSGQDIVIKKMGWTTALHTQTAHGSTP
jgi:hypothetical protein